MSDPTILLGFIAEKNPNYSLDPDFYRRANDATIAALPEDDAHPPLCRSLFSVTGGDALHGSYGRQRIIHFAGKFNHFVNDLAPWLDKFEAMLRKLYWINAEVLIMNAAIGPSLALKFLVTQDTADDYHSNPPRLPRDWTLRVYGLDTWGPPRSDFADYLGQGRALSPHDS
jgi:hypothetical protein